MTIIGHQLTTRRFPLNAENLSIRGIDLYIRSSECKNIVIDDLKFKENGTIGQGIGGSAAIDNGLISTTKGNAGSWLVIAGKPFRIWDFEDSKFQNR
jgi:hypothetical protein